MQIHVRSCSPAHAQSLSLHLYAQYLYAVHHALTPLSLDLFASSPLSLSLSASACSVTSSQRVTCLFVSTVPPPLHSHP